jgi:hypothetical protein
MKLAIVAVFCAFSASAALAQNDESLSTSSITFHKARPVNVPQGTVCAVAKHYVGRKVVPGGYFCIPASIIESVRQASARRMSADAATPQDATSDPDHQTLVAVATTAGGSNYFPAAALALYQQFTDLVEPTRFALTEPATPLPATISVAQSPSQGYFGSIPGLILASIPSSTETMPYGIDYLGFLHELMHQSLPAVVLSGQDIGLHEGLASGKVDLIYTALYAENPAWFAVQSVPITVTAAAAVDQYNNDRPLVYGGANRDGMSEFYENSENNFDAIDALLSVVIDVKTLGGDYRKLDAAINKDLPQTRADFLALLDREFPGVTVDGMKLSTFMQKDITAVADAKAGESYCGIRPIGGVDLVRYSSVGDGEDWPFNPQAYLPLCVTWTTAADGTIVPTRVDGNVTWGIKDAWGNWLAQNQQSPLYADTAMDLGNNPILNPKSTGGDLWYENYPTQAVTIVADMCINDSTGQCSIVGPQFSDLDHIILLNEELNPGDVAVIDDHEGWGTLATSCSLTVLAPASAVTVESYSGLCVFRNLPKDADGFFEDLTVTDGSRVQTYTPDPRGPIAHTFVLRNESVPGQVVSAEEGAAITAVTPNGSYVLQGSYLCMADPSTASLMSAVSTGRLSRLQPPADGCSGTASNKPGLSVVRFTAPDGKTFDSSLTYTSPGQINFTAPSQIGRYVGQTVELSTIVNGVKSFRSLPFTVGPVMRYQSPRRGPAGR